MKKIVGAVLVATMLTGAAMADVGFSYKSSNYFTTAGGNLTYDHAARKDCLGVTMSNDFGGAVVDFDVDGGAMVQDEYYGWLNFTLPVGQLQVTAGKWNGRLVNRVKKDAGNLDGADFEKFKPGILKGKVGSDSDNLTEGKIAVVAAYTLSDVLPGKLMAKVGLVNGKWNPDAKAAVNATNVDSALLKPSKEVEDSDFIFNAGFVGEFSYQQDDLIKAIVSYKTFTKGTNVVGIFVSPLMIKNVDLMAGFTYGGYHEYDSKNTRWNTIKNEWGIDLRAQIKITDDLSITTMNNLSRSYRGDLGETKTNHEMIFWNMVNATYKIADNLKAALTLNTVADRLTTPGTRKDAMANRRNICMTISPALHIQATEKVSVTTSLRFQWDDIDFAHWDVTNNISSLKVPVIVKVSL